MALPTTVALTNSQIFNIGPFISSGGNVYFFGRDVNSPFADLKACKATDPTTSFSVVATQTGFATSIRSLAGCQVGDVIHLLIQDGSISSTNIKYQTFNMSSDTFVTAENISLGVNPQTSASGTFDAGGIEVRSGGEVVVHYPGPRVANMGNSYAQTYYSRRTGVNTWSAAVQVSPGGTVDYIRPCALMGASDAVHFFFQGSTPSGKQVTLSSGNVLQTASSGYTTNNNTQTGISYVNGGNTHVVATDGGAVQYFDSSNTPSINVIQALTNGGVPSRVFNDGTDLWILGRKTTDNDLYVAKSTDGGGTWGTQTNVFVGTLGGFDTDLSRDGNIFQRGNDFVIPYIVNDNSTLKYNEYVVRSIVTTKAYPPFSGPVRFWNKRF